MNGKYFKSFLVVIALAFAAVAQDAPQKPSLISGEVVSVLPDKIVFKTADGGSVDAILSDKTQFVRVQPDTQKQVPSAISEIEAGDKVIASGYPAADKKSVPAIRIYLMSKTDLALRQQKEREDWRVRGMVGRVSKVDLVAKTITLSQRGFGGERLTVVKPADGAVLLRYAPDSVEVAKAQPGSLGEIQVNDEIRVLGNKNAEGTEVAAEKIITGAFRTNTGKIKSINVEKNEIVATDIATKKDFTIVVGEGSMLRAFPAEMAQRLAQVQVMMAMGGGQGGMGGGMMRPGGGGQVGGQPNGGAGGQGGGQQMGPPNGGAGQGGPGGPGGGGMRMGGGGAAGAIDDTKFPAIKISDLKVGDDVGVMSTRTSDSTRVKAIKLFSGIEPFIKASETIASRPGGGGGRGGEGGGGGGASLSIPGLDGGFGGN